MNQYKIITGLLLLAALPSFAQDKNKASFQEIFIEDISGFTMSKIATPTNIFNQKLNLNNDYTYTLVNKSELKDDLGFLHYKTQQYYKGIKVEHAILNLHSKSVDMQTKSPVSVKLHFDKFCFDD